MLKRKFILSASLGLGIVAGGWLMLHTAKRPQPSFSTIAAPAEPVTVYRWRDETGAQVFSGEAPPPGVAFTTDTLDGHLNTMNFPKPAAPSEPTANQPINPLSVYTPGGMQQLVQQAKQAKQAVEQSQQRTISQIKSQN